MYSVCKGWWNYVKKHGFLNIQFSASSLGEPCAMATVCIVTTGNVAVNLHNIGLTATEGIDSIWAIKQLIHKFLIADGT